MSSIWNRPAIRAGVVSLSAVFGAVVLAASSAPPIVVSADVVVRERANAVTSIGIGVIDKLPGARSLDQLIATLPADRKVTPGRLPDGWNFNQQGKQIRLSGPAVGAVDVRLDLDGNYGNDYIGKQATLQYGLRAKLESIKITIESLPKVSATPNLEGILTYPPEATRGQPFLIGVADPYRRGSWELTTSGGSVPLISLDALRDMEVIKTGVPQALYGLRGGEAMKTLLSRSGSQPFITAAPEMGRFTSARYTDRWGEVTVDAPLTITPVMPVSGARVLSGGSAFAFAGQSACVAGRFPAFTDPFALTLDGTIPLPVWGASQTAVMVGIPETATPGLHTIRDDSGSSSITVGVLTVQGTLDQNKLWRGESTTMRLRILGTEQPIPLGVLNRSPEVITIGGGVQQTLTTPGGKDNAVTRDVTGIRRGNFTIVYSVKTDGCGSGTAGR